jgi:hypothetical protein
MEQPMVNIVYQLFIAGELVASSKTKKEIKQILKNKAFMYNHQTPEPFAPTIKKTFPHYEIKEETR